MDVYFSRMKELTRTGNVSSDAIYVAGAHLVPPIFSDSWFGPQDVIELRERKWVSRNQVAAPSTIAQVHEGYGSYSFNVALFAHTPCLQAAKDRAAC